MRTIIAGSRKGVHYIDIVNAVDKCGWRVTHVIDGAAPGADQFANQWAIANGIPYTRVPADWARYGNSAGPIRNARMAEIAEALIAIRVGGPSSKGTTDMIDQARKKGLRVYVLEKSKQVGFFA